VPNFRGGKRESARPFPTLWDPYARDGHRFESSQLQSRQTDAVSGSAEILAISVG